MSLFQELKRRNVFRVAIAYAVTAWVLLQLTEVLTELLELNTDIGKMVIVLLLIGFIPALIFAWAFELTPDGLKRESEVDRSSSITPQTGRRLDRAIIVVLTVALAWFAWDKFGTAFSPAESEPVTQVADEGETAESAASEASSIAVLPFVNMSADPDNEYFSDGLSEELGMLLAGVDGLKVAARTSSFKFKNSDADIAEIGERLKVETVLEGSVRRAGDQVRITAQLIKVEDGFPLWSETYDRRLDNIFAVQDEIARSIAHALSLPLLGEEQAFVSNPPAAGFEAFDLYLLGQHQARSLTGEGFAKAIDLFSQAVALDPRYVPAWSALAEAYLGTVSWGNASWFSVMDDAEAAVEQALMLDPNSVDALLAKSMMLRFQQKDAEARALDEQALATDPMNPEALRRMADTLRSTDPQQSLANAEQALDIDPLSELIRITVIRSTRKALGMGPARERYEEFLAQDPDSWVLIEQWARLEDNAGNSDLAILEFEKVFSLREDAYSAAAMAILYLDLGDEAEAERWAEQARELGPDSEWTRGLTFRFAWYRQDFETLMSLLRAQSETPQGKDPLYYSGLGQVLMAMDRPEEAEAAFRQSLQMLAPDETAIPTGLELSVIGELAFLLPQGTERSQLVERIRARYEAIRLADPDSRPVAALAAQIALLEDHRDDYFAAASRAIDTGYRGRRWMELEVSYRVWKDDPRFSELLGRLDQIAADQRARLEAARAEAAHNAGVSI